MKSFYVLAIAVLPIVMALSALAMPVEEEDDRLRALLRSIENKGEESMRSGNEPDNSNLGLESQRNVEQEIERRQSDCQTYIGCFKDDGGRHFSYLKNYGWSTSLAVCRQHCSSRGYKYLGLQATDWCLCGNNLFKEGYPLVDDSECNLFCKGEYNRKCGGHWRNSIYFV